MLKFREAVLSVAAEMQRSGKISRWELFRLRLQLWMPALLAEYERAALAELSARGVDVADAAAIDWDKLREFLEWFIPLLLELIGKFSTPLSA